jgi:hypothetical protein
MKLAQKKLLLLCSLTVLFASCLKKDTTYYDASASPAVIGFGDYGTPGFSGNGGHPNYFADLGVVKTGDTMGYNINVIYAGVTAAPQDITVNIGLDPAGLSAYNDSDGTSYVLSPAGIITFPTTVVIKAGTKMGTARGLITVTSAFDFSLDYALPLKITSVSSNTTISSNLGSAIYTYSARNIYDGDYKILSGTVQRYNSPGSPTVNDALNGDLTGNPDILLTTKSGTSVAIPPALTAGGLYWAHGNNSFVSGIDGTTVTIDPATNKVTMSSTGNNTLANWTTSVGPTGGGDSYYDPAAKKFYLFFWWNPTSTMRTYKMVLQYVGAR